MTSRLNVSGDLDVLPGGKGADEAARSMASALVEGGKEGLWLDDTDKWTRGSHDANELCCSQDG